MAAATSPVAGLSELVSSSAGTVPPRLFRPWDLQPPAEGYTPSEDINTKEWEDVAPRVPDYPTVTTDSGCYWSSWLATSLELAAGLSPSSSPGASPGASPSGQTTSSVGKQRPKKFRCPHCDVAFSNNGQLKGHVRIHTGERPFRCEAEGCGKSFTRNEELTRHKRIHSGLRPFPCDSCGKTFGRKDHLKKHLRTHLPQPSYVLPPPHLFMYPYIYGY